MRQDAGLDPLGRLLVSAAAGIVAEEAGEIRRGDDAAVYSGGGKRVDPVTLLPQIVAGLRQLKLRIDVRVQEPGGFANQTRIQRLRKLDDAVFCIISPQGEQY